ncbi:hypothetical protein BJ944DRAFT_272504 [Cunninghamella echinulata]|nr:hypothetical protein BJ944DRAFT_272504 [Cunninghamella echinulata]
MNQKITTIVLVFTLLILGIHCQSNIFDRVIAEEGISLVSGNKTKRDGCGSFQTDCGTYCCGLTSQCHNGGCCPTASTPCSDSVGKCCPLGTTCIPNSDKCRGFSFGGGSSDDDDKTTSSGSNTSKNSADSIESFTMKQLLLSSLALLLVSALYFH